MYTNYITRDKSPAPSETISHVPCASELRNTLSGKGFLPRTRDPARKYIFISHGRAELVPLKAKRHRWEDSRSDETGRRRDPTNDTPELALRTLSTGVEATPMRGRDSS